MTGLLFLGDGTGKFFGFPPDLPFISEEPPLLLYCTATMEFVGGILIILGLFTRPVAFVLSGYMAVAYFWMHFPNSFFPAINDGIPAVLFCFVYLYLAVAGPAPGRSTQGLSTLQQPKGAPVGEKPSQIRGTELYLPYYPGRLAEIELAAKGRDAALGQ